MNKKLHRILCAAFTTIFASSFVVEYGLRKGAEAYADTYPQTSYTDVTGKYSTANVMAENFNASVFENTQAGNVTRTVIVSLEGKSVLDGAKGADVGAYLGTVEGKNLDADITAKQNAFLKKLTAAGVAYKLKNRYSVIDNAVAIEVNVDQIRTIKALAGVKSAIVSETYAAPKTVESATASGATINESSVYATGVYDTSVFAKEYGHYGEGTIVAVLDTGLDATHAAFQGFYSEIVNGQDVALAYDKQGITDIFAGEELSAEKKSLTSKNYKLKASDVYVNDKIPFAYDYADDDFDVYPSYSNHGMHVAGIVAGYDPNGYDDKDGVHHDEPFIGAAPDAQLMICKVFTDDLDDKDLGGAVTEDILAALEDCIILGVDVINMSLGTSAGFSTTGYGEDDEGDYLQTVYDEIQDVGISLICAASNDYSSGYGGTFGTNLASNPDSGTVGSPGTYSAAMAVASISGQLSPYMIANEGTSYETAVYYEESNDENNNPFDFSERMLALAEELDVLQEDGSATFEYVVAGKGTSTDFAEVRSLFTAKPYQRIALIERGDNTFQEKVENAIRAQAGAVIVYNNVAGTIRMSLGEIDDPMETLTGKLVPVRAVSIGLEAGRAMKKGALNNLGVIKIDPALEAGPFMSDFSSWGATPDLKLKPDITAHGGEITSAVPGGYDEQSGTSMASPNMAGVTALLRSYIKHELQEKLGLNNAVEINRLTNQLIMSTATIAYDREGLPYSPRKQGAGLASLENMLATTAYLSTENAENDFRPKAELGDKLDAEDKRDTQGRVTFDVSFNVTNFGSNALTFKLRSIMMTETLSEDGLAVAEQAYLFGAGAKNGALIKDGVGDGVATTWTVAGAGSYTDGDVISVGVGQTLKLTATMTLSETEENYIKKTFVNGMYVEGFLELVAQNGEGAQQCDLVLPFMGFYGDWTQAPMLDYSIFELAKYEQDASIDDEDKPDARVWATQPYASYYGEKFIVPMGSYVYALPEYTSDPVFDKMYANEDYVALSCYSIEGDEDGIGEYMTSNAIKAVYAGLLRNAREVRYQLYNEETGELLLGDTLWRVGKAYSGGGSAVPANVELNISPIEYNFASGSKYRMQFEFFLDYNEGEGSNKNTYEFTFTVDYEAPILEDLRIRYEDYEEDNQKKQRIYLDVDVYDNHYPQSVMLLYLDEEETKDETDNVLQLKLATDYIIPIRKPVKNATTTVSYEITNIYEKYKTGLYMQIDDYALNHTLYKLDINTANSSVAPDSFTLKEGEDKITLGVNETHKVGLAYEGNANLSNFTWESLTPNTVKVRNGELFGVKAGTGRVRVSNGRDASTMKTINVTVVDNGKKLGYPSVSFGLVRSEMESLKKAAGTVDVNTAENFKLEILTEPWYYNVSDYKFRWTTSNAAVATVDGNGNVQTLKEGSATITATLLRADGVTATSYGATVTLAVQDPFKVSNFTLTDYAGAGGVVEIPLDKNIMYIGEDAFKDNTEITEVIIPKTVVEIQESAFEGCTNLEAVYFIDKEAQDVADANLKLIHEKAFLDCTSLETLDLRNTKTFTVAAEVFKNCTALSTIHDLKKIGTLHDRAFENCVSLVEVDLSGLHMSGEEVFKGCINLASVTMSEFTAIGERMFAGLTRLTELSIPTPKIGAGAFEGCTGLESVELAETAGKNVAFEIGANAFRNCTRLSSLSFGGQTVRVLGDYAFAGCSALTQFTMPDGLEELGSNILKGSGVNTLTIRASETFDFVRLERTGVLFDHNFVVTLATDKATANKYAKENGVIYELDSAGNKSKIVLANEAVGDQNGLYIVPDTVQEILAYAFAGSKIASVKFGSGLSVLGEGAFQGATLKEVIWNGNTNITDVPAYAFADCLALKQIQLPNEVAQIGAFAFKNSALASISLAGVKKVNDGAFAGTQFVSVDLSTSTITQMGDGVFENCTLLTSAKLPALEALGYGTFLGASALQTVTFAEGARVTGDATFFKTPVQSVTLGEGVTAIGEWAFSGCRALTEITLPTGVTAIGNYAFEGCEALTAVYGLENVASIGDYAFKDCLCLETSLKATKTLALTAAKTIGAGAFAMSDRVNESGVNVATVAAYTALTFRDVEKIGAMAFYNGGMAAVSLPAGVTEIGYGAFAAADRLTAISVADNEKYFVEDGVLYRNVEGAYELVAYPSAKADEVYTIKAGTVAVLAYAFSGLGGNLEEVDLPYTMKSIGDSAFYNSGIDVYVFHSMNAPTLETIFRYEVMWYLEEQASLLGKASEYRGFYYANFETLFVNFTEFGNRKSTLTIKYPSNAKGYDNYLYKNYFGNVQSLGVEIDDTTRKVRDLIDELPSVAEVEAWKQLSATQDNKNTVLAFADKLLAIRNQYNAVKDPAQIALITAQSEKLTAIEQTLREVRSTLGIAAKVSKLTYTGTYKMDYVSGEVFDPTGLTFYVVYDDGTQEVAEWSKLTFHTEPLTVFDGVVKVTGYGKTVRVTVIVSGQSSNQPSTSEEEDKGCKSNVAAGGALAGLCLAGLALLRKKREK